MSSYNQGGDSGNESEDEYKTNMKIGSNILVGIDCSESMFPLDFKKVLQAVHKVCDTMVMSRTSKNKIAIVLFHPEPEKRSILDFDSNFMEGLVHLNKLIKTDDLDEYKISKSNSFNFAQFLLECKKKFKQLNNNDMKIIYFITNNSDPCGDANVCFQARQEFSEMKESNIIFKLLPLIENFDYAPFYDDVFKTLDASTPNYYYNEEFLGSTIGDSIKYREVNYHLKLHLSANSNPNCYIDCIQTKVARDAKLLPNKNVTRNGKEVKRKVKRNQISSYSVKFGNDYEVNSIQKLGFTQTGHIKLGIQLLHASTARYSETGMNHKNPALLRSKHSDDKKFGALWEACVERKNNLLCSVKYREGGKVHALELVPVSINQERFFEMYFIPNSINIRLPKQDEIFVEKDKSGLFTDLVEKATLTDYDMTKIKPWKFSRETEYFKQELFKGNAIKFEKDIDLLNECHYDEGVLDLVMQLQNMYPDVSGAKRGKKPAGNAPKKPKK